MLNIVVIPCELNHNTPELLTSSYLLICIAYSVYYNMSHNLRVMKKNKSLILRQVLFTAVASSDCDAYYNTLEDVESELSSLENKHSSTFCYTSPGHHAEFYRSCQEENELYMSFQELSHRLELSFITPDHQSELYGSCQEERLTNELDSISHLTKLSYTQPARRSPSGIRSMGTSIFLLMKISIISQMTH